MIQLHGCANPECDRQVRVEPRANNASLTFNEDGAWVDTIYVCSEACREAIEGTFEEV